MPRYTSASERSAAISEAVKRAEETAVADAEAARVALENHYLLVISTWTQRTDAAAPASLEVPVDPFSKETLNSTVEGLSSAGYNVEVGSVLSIVAPQ